ncbi:HNH endonuclease [Comamonas sp.]|uniref:HNH endonuclease n=1 Tax=Comamonas sp. TaxID=34028 RepID=UPI003A8E61CA
MTSRARIDRAINSFLKGVRPPSFRNSQFWFVLGPNGELLPAKAIWALVTNISAANFNTTHAVSGLSESGYSVIDIRHSSSAKNFDDDVHRSLATPSDERKKRLASAKKFPAKELVVVERFIRNPDVVAEVLERAGGYCERCTNYAPFLRRHDNMPYLEVHHKVPLAQGGDDTVENAEALCPNCHRNAHYG